MVNLEYLLEENDDIIEKVFPYNPDEGSVVVMVTVVVV